MNLITRAGICALILMVGFVSAARAQLILNRQVTATTGASGTVGNGVRIQYTIGEPVIAMITDGRTLLTQGFQQPEELPPFKPGESTVKSYMVFPNPVATLLKIQLDMIAQKDVQLALLTTAGQVIYVSQQVMGAGVNTVTVPVNKFAAGIYTLRIKVGGLETFYEKVIIQ